MAHLVELLIKHRHLDHLLIKDKHLNFFQYFMIDVIAFLAGILALGLGLLFWTLKVFCLSSSGKDVVDVPDDDGAKKSN